MNQHASQANLLYPPPSLLLVGETSETSSIRPASFSIRSSTKYNRSVSVKDSQAFALTDWRSLYELMSSSSSLRTGDFSPGHYAGRGINFLGIQILKPIIYIQIKAHLRKCRRRVEKMKRLDREGRRQYFERKGAKFLISSQDLLELSE